MSLSTGAFQVLFIIQHFVPLRFLVNIKTQRFKKNPLYQNHYSLCYRIISEFSLLFALLPFAVVRIAWLIFRWKSYTVNNVDELIIYGAITFSIQIYLPVSVLFHTATNFIIKTGNNACQIGVQDGEKVLNDFREFLGALFQDRSIKPLFAYGLALPFIL